MFLAGRFKIFPAILDANGIGLSFAIDSLYYQIEASQMASLLHAQQFTQWWAFNAQPHVKLYSLCFAALGPFVGFNIISAEPLNLVLYLLLVTATYALGSELFGTRTGLIAAGMVAVWPSLLLHTTQMLRDPLFILAFLLFVLVLVVNLTRRLSIIPALLSTVAGTGTVVLLWLIRGDMWELIFLLLLIGILMSAARQLAARRLLPGNALVALILLFAAFLIPKIIPTFRQQDSALQAIKGIDAGAKTQLPEAVFGRAEATSNTGLTKLTQRVGVLRHKFIIQYPLAGSNIDTHVELTGPRDVVSYLPRAIEIGLFAPFPNMWFKKGARVGWEGRLLSGFETLCMYAITLLAVVCIVVHRRKFPVWLFFLIILMGCAALGYVVVNISTLYRMRYGFWILLVILGANGLLGIATRWGSSGGHGARHQESLTNA